MPIESVNPATGTLIQKYEEMDPETVDQILDGAERAHRPGALCLSPSERPGCKKLPKSYGGEWNPTLNR